MTLNTSNSNDSNRLNRPTEVVNHQVKLPPQISKITIQKERELEDLKSEIELLKKDFRKKKTTLKALKASGEKGNKLTKKKAQIKSIKAQKTALTARLQNIKSQFNFYENRFDV